jgi:hypothetical protein
MSVTGLFEERSSTAWMCSASGTIPPPQVFYQAHTRGRSGRRSMNEFQFKTKLDLTLLLGRRARNAVELLQGVREAPDSCIYYHTHRFLQQHNYLSPEPPNDFAYWASEVVNDVILGEALWSIDIVQFGSIAELRTAFTEVLSSHVKNAANVRECPPGGEFHFMASRTFVLTTNHVAQSLAEFRHILRDISVNSLYYHMFDARLRLEASENDFSRWFKVLGKDRLAEETARLDPYSHTLEGLRKRILVLTERYGKD